MIKYYYAYAFGLKLVYGEGLTPEEYKEYKELSNKR